ncbi:MAG: GntR family transcriptional regulator [Bosea sp. (in: a-proteobacteria)]
MPSAVEFRAAPTPGTEDRVHLDLVSAPQPRDKMVADHIRQGVNSGILTPGSHLSESGLCSELQVSRNTVREAFRFLTQEGLLRHEANRGVFVTTPSPATIVDVFRVRRTIECPALAQAYPKHPAVQQMRAAVKKAEASRRDGDWRAVGNADIAFHAAVVALTDSPRLMAFFRRVSLELRLVFGLIRSPEFLHEPYIERNRAILEALESGDAAGAAEQMDRYLAHAERFILTTYARVLDGEDA